jgi:hypothetical protein
MARDDSFKDFVRKFGLDVIDEVMEGGWTEFIRSCDEIGWERRLIVEGDTRANVLTAMREAWKN